MAIIELFCEDENGNPTETRCAWRGDADPELAEMVIQQPIETTAGGGNFRSAWHWFRLADGGLVLGCYPHGETYFATEHDPERP